MGLRRVICRHADANAHIASSITTLIDKLTVKLVGSMSRTGELAVLLEHHRSDKYRRECLLNMGRL